MKAARPPTVASIRAHWPSLGFGDIPHFIASRWAAAKPSGAAAPRKALAILIGVENYNRLPDLRWCKDDVQLVRETLSRCCACSEIVVMTTESEEEFKPTRGNIMAVLTARLRFADQEQFDRVFIYFAGHGLCDTEGSLYLAPQDYAFDLIRETGVGIAFMREKLNECRRVGEKILILDTCHAGSRRGDPGGPSAAEIAGELRGTPRLFTLASCGPEQESLEWNQKGHGLFTYWLCEGLSGGADRKPNGNGNGRVDTDELTEFVARNVERTSLDLGRPQRPVALYADETPWKAELAFLPPEPAEPERASILGALAAEAQKYRSGGNYAAAIEQLTRALAIDPADPGSFALRGIVYLDRGKSRGETVDPDLAVVDFQAAIDDLDRAIAHGQDRAAPEGHLASWYSKRSDAHFQLGQYEKALADACKAIDLEPASAQAYGNRAKIYRSRNEVKKAERDEQRAREVLEEARPSINQGT